MEGSLQQKLSFAVLIDYDNLAIGVKTALDRKFEYKYVTKWLQERGDLLEQIAYANWDSHNDKRDVSRSLERQGVRLRNLETWSPGSKNGADIALSVEAMELVFKKKRIDAFCILSGDSDFRPLVHKLKQYDKRVVIVAGQGFTSEALQRECHEFVRYEALCGHPSYRGLAAGKTMVQPVDRDPVDQAVPAVRAAIRALLSKSEIADVPRIKSELTARDPNFDERRYGCDSLGDLVDRLVQMGHFRRINLGGSRYCIAEHSEVRRIETDASLDASPEATPDATPDRDRAAAAVDRAVAALRAEGRMPELGLVYRRIIQMDPSFESYGCRSAEFQKLAWDLSLDGRFNLASKGGAWVIEPPARSTAHMPAQALAPAALSLFNEIRSVHAELLECGVPEKQMELFVATHREFRPERLGVTDASGLLASAVREGLLERRATDSGTQYFATSRGKFDAVPRPQTEGADSDDAPDMSIDAAIKVVCATLRQNAESLRAGLTRQAIRDLVRASDPQFDVRAYGLRSFRELLDRVRDAGHLRVEDDGTDLRYFDARLLDQEEAADSTKGRRSIWDRLFGWLRRRAG